MSNDNNNLKSLEVDKRENKSLDVPVELAVYDFDGTCIAGNSPVMLVYALAKAKKLRPTILARILLWAAAYKLRLPQNEVWVRGLVFSAFAGQPAEEVDSFLRNFYDQQIQSRFRPQAHASMIEHHNKGRVVMIVSASFYPIIQRARENHPFDFQISTRMGIDGAGCYMRSVDGPVVEGLEKPRAIERFADEHWGKGNWILSYAYGDHHSDQPMLRAAEHPCAVCPDRPLRRTARREGWRILDWDSPHSDYRISNI